MSAWIKMIPDQEAGSELRKAFDAARTPHGTVDNVMRVHSLRPATMHGHVVLYRAVLHDDGNTLPEWLQETIGSYVSLLNQCDYSFANHWKNARHLIGDDARSDAIATALAARQPERAFSGAELAALDYARKLTLSPGDITESDVAGLREAGLDDGQILEVNQIVGYFNYANRLLNGLGVTTDGDVIGYYPEPDAG
ncbi:MAG: peroxidase-related enzyme [Paracoccaceae bacterium]|nr:peroxidase-related enzyme [Paracoccaceae bacterium]MDE2914712.1 peroxidase-related enzyme [Paracoccaceae bacterium]